MSNLSKETRERIVADTLRHAEQQHGHDDIHPDYLAGALHEAERAESVIEMLQNIYTGYGHEWLPEDKEKVETILTKYKEVSNG